MLRLVLIENALGVRVRTADRCSPALLRTSQSRWLSGPSSSPTSPSSPKSEEPLSSKSKEEIGTKLKQALLDASKQAKKKPPPPPASVQPHSSGPSTPPSTAPTPAPPAPAAAAATTSEAVAGTPVKPVSIKRESTFERLGQRLKRAFTDAQAEAPVAMPPPNAVKVSPHLVTRSQVTPAKNLLLLVQNVSSAALKSSLLIPATLWRAVLWTGRGIAKIVRDPSIVRTGSAKLWKSIKHEAAHYWTGFKVLGLELKTSGTLLSARLQGKELTRRERQQLQRSYQDLMKMGPFLVFVIVPFMEFTLPIFLKLFPNMLPSPFIDEKQKAMTRKNIGQIRLEMASFMQEMVAEVESKVRNKGADPKTVSALVEFVERSRRNEPLRPETLPVLLKTFSDELTIERMSRENLQMMCRFMGVSTIGSDDFLRYSLLSRLRAVRQDDVHISWEGVESLNLDELRLAALERGMQAESDDVHHYRRQLARWIELSVVHNVSPAMLILSRAFAVAGPPQAPGTDPTERVEQVLASIEPKIVKDALVSAVDDVASAPKLENDLDKTVLQKAKLESIRRENELIEEEIDEQKHQKQNQQQAQLGLPSPNASILPENKPLKASAQTPKPAPENAQAPPA